MSANVLDVHLLTKKNKLDKLSPYNISCLYSMSNKLIPMKE